MRLLIILIQLLAILIQANYIKEMRKHMKDCEKTIIRLNNENDDLIKRIKKAWITLNKILVNEEKQ